MLHVSIQLQISSSVCRTLLGVLAKIEDYLTLDRATRVCGGPACIIQRENKLPGLYGTQCILSRATLCFLPFKLFIAGCTPPGPGLTLSNF